VVGHLDTDHGQTGDALILQLPRLRLMPNDGSDNYKNLHNGARALGEGLYWAVRNIGMYTPPPTDGGEEQLALEQLAAFSLLARWADQATVEFV
jgi:hypothetical protein